MGQRYRETEDQKPWPAFSSNQDFAEKRGLESKVKTSESRDASSKLVYLEGFTDGGCGLRPQLPDFIGVWEQSPQPLGDFLH